MEIIQSTPPANVVIAIHFIQPFAAQNTVEFILESRNTQDERDAVETMNQRFCAS